MEGEMPVLRPAKRLVGEWALNPDPLVHSFRWFERYVLAKQFEGSNGKVWVVPALLGVSKFPHSNGSNHRVVRMTHDMFLIRGNWRGVFDGASKHAKLDEVTTIRIESIPTEKIREVSKGYQALFGLKNPKFCGHEIELSGEEWAFPDLDTLIIRIKVKA
jgi:hypothetical protein